MCIGMSRSLSNIILPDGTTVYFCFIVHFAYGPWMSRHQNSLCQHCPDVRMAHDDDDETSGSLNLLISPILGFMLTTLLGECDDGIRISKNSSIILMRLNDFFLFCFANATLGK